MDLTTTYLGKKLRSPLVVSACGPLSEEIGEIRRAEDAGPATTGEAHAAALQYVRKVAGVRTMPKDTRELDRAVEAIAKATSELLAGLPSRGEPRTREGERERARAKWAARAR